MQLQFLPGHPRNDVLYVAHPAISRIYYPLAQFHRMSFEHKFAEAVGLLMSLGVVTIEVEHVAGWSSEIAAKLGVALPPAPIDIGGEAKLGQKVKNRLLFQASLDGTNQPALPEDLVWYHHEPTWQRIAEGRMKYGLKDFVLHVSYEDDYGINARMKVKASRVGLELGGHFEDHESTVWRLSGKFSPK